MSKTTHTKRRSGLDIMAHLVVFVAPLIGVMGITVVMGVLGFLCAIFITVFGAVGIVQVLGIPLPPFTELSSIIYILVALALLRGILRYLEQYSGHFIAFKLLALIRDKVYKALRRLAPAKLDGKRAGRLISIITADIELLEVFYAHTIAPIIIAIITSAIMICIIGYFSLPLALIAFVAYATIGFVIPYLTSGRTREAGREYRENMSDINSAFLESLYGMRELLLFNEGAKRQQLMDAKSERASSSVRALKHHQGVVRALTESAILGFSMVMLFTGVYLVMQHALGFRGFFISLICLMSSFGPVVALSNLSNSLLLTFASGERVLDLINEPELIAPVVDGKDITDTNIAVKDISFSYDGQTRILHDMSMDIAAGKVIGIYGKSGSGKSTLLKLLMRFYDVDSGEIDFGRDNIKDINTASLRENISYVTQTTYIFNASILENLRVAKRNATMEEIRQACKKANIHDFIESLPHGYNSEAGELGDMLSGGEQQRIGLARAFLHNSRIILLDEPTSNLDSLNEGIILNSLKNLKSNSDNKGGEKSIILVSHRLSTLSICDRIYRFESERES